MDWREQEITRNLSEAADRFRVQSSEVVSVKFRPVLLKPGSEWQQSYFGGYESSRFADAFDRGDSRDQLLLIQHESGSEIITRIAEWASISGLVLSAWSLVWTYLASRKPDEPRGSDLSHIRIEVRKLDAKGNLREERVVDLDLSRHLSEAEVKQALASAISEIGKFK